MMTDLPGYIPLFSYGSNMYSKRLKSRVPSALNTGVAKLEKYRIVFDKIGKDGSAKATIIHTGLLADVVWGTIALIPEHQKYLLDEAEGLGKGYNQHWITVKPIDQAWMSVLTYIADASYLDRHRKPFHWYKDLVVAGAVENHLDPDYIAMLGSIPSVADPDVSRREKERTILD